MIMNVYECTILRHIEILKSYDGVEFDTMNTPNWCPNISILKLYEPTYDELRDVHIFNSLISKFISSQYGYMEYLSIFSL
jgi:hypothetical protein